MTVNNNDVIAATAVLEVDALEDLVNSYQFQLLSGGPVSDQNVVDDIAAVLDVLYLIINALISTLVIYREVRGQNLTQDILLGTAVWPTLVAGADVGVIMPFGVAGLVRFPTNVPRVQLRKFIGVFTEGSNTQNGQWSAAVLTALALFGTGLLAQQAINGRTYQYGYLSPKTLSFVVPNASLATTTTAYQRRRKPGVGS